MTIKDIAGQKFGRLTALVPTKERGENGGVIWECKCECGRICFVSLNNLTKGGVQSCGCLGTENSKTNMQKAVSKHLKEHIVEGTNIPAISRKEVKANNTSGTTGVIWDKSRNKWVAVIKFKNNTYRLGRYKLKEDAVKARKEAEEKLHGSFLEWYKENYKEMGK